MALVVYKAGESLGWRSLGGVLESRWAEQRSMINRAIATRKASGAPLVNESTGQPMSDIGDYPGDPQLADAEIEIVALSVSDMHALEAADEKAGATPGEKLAAQKAAVRKMVSGVRGLALADGTEIAFTSLDDAALSFLADALLIEPILTAASWLQSVRGDVRKNSGALQPSKTSVNTTATHALSHLASSGAVTMTPPPYAGRA